ncbi:hypothetical protein [Streptomyces dysideae]|uniref:hypothetical protein n=1 Tax=Streptomyces dysideae TaxID=909626 RepID=UPI00131A7A76|nr:hypothetical protein [Streptomyces dysideae]
MSGERERTPRAVRIEQELMELRQRGVSSVDTKTHNQLPLKLAELTALANIYGDKAGMNGRSRPEILERLIAEALKEFEKKGEKLKASVVQELFFGKKGHKRRPGVLLKEARERAGVSETTFRENYQKPAFGTFSDFLDTWNVQNSARQDDCSDGDSQQGYPPEGSPTRYELSAARRKRRNRRKKGCGGITIVIVIGFISSIVYYSSIVGYIRHEGAQGISNGPHADGTYTELAGESGSAVFDDPRHPSKEGERIIAGLPVRVSCILTVSADGDRSQEDLWYRIASDPWNDKWYARAKNFWRDDNVKKIPTCN